MKSKLGYDWFMYLEFNVWYFFYDKCCIWLIVYCLLIWFVSFLNVFFFLYVGEWEYFRIGVKVFCKFINLVYKGGVVFSLVIEMYFVDCFMLVFNLIYFFI